jgi:hypothetical protein
MRFSIYVKPPLPDAAHFTARPSDTSRKSVCEKATYDMVKRSGTLTPASVCALLNVDPQRLTDFVEYDPAYAINFTILRLRPSGSPGGDIYGAWQYAPFLDVEIDVTN